MDSASSIWTGSDRSHGSIQKHILTAMISTLIFLLRVAKSQSFIVYLQPIISFRLYNENIMREAADNIARNGQMASKTSAYDPKIICVTDFIEKNISHQIPMFSLCQIANVSESTLVKNFKLIYDKTPRTYIENVRITRATKLLLTSNLSLAEIAYRTGFTH
jgi:AraC-like DNA-binding protein